MQPPANTDPARGPADSGPGDFGPGRFAVLLAALIFAAFPQVLLGLQTFVVRDYGFFAYPLAAYQRECFWRGELPFWNPYNNCGLPFLAQWNTMALYPPALIYLLLPLGWSLSFFCLLHLFWAGLGMYFLANRWSGNRYAAAVAGIIFAFNGLSLNFLMWPSHIATLSWMPWVVLTVEGGWREGGRKLLAAALVGALQMLAGGPETILFTWLLLLAVWLVGGRPGAAPAAGAAAQPVCARHVSLGRFVLVVWLVAGLAAVQLLPFLDLASHSQREQGFADARWSMPSWGWANFLVPMVFGRIWNKGVFFQYDQAWTSSYYLGMGALLLALLALWQARERRVRLLAIAALAAFLLALGDQIAPGRWLRQGLPQLSLMTYPVKFVTVIIFAGPLLAAFAVAGFLKSVALDRKVQERRVIGLATILALLIGIILLWAWWRPFPTDNFGDTLRNGLSRLVILAIGVALLLAVGRASLDVRSSSTFWRRCLPWSLLVLCWLDVWTHVPPQNPTVPASIYAPGLAREKLAMKPQPTLGVCRAMVSPAAQKKFTQFILSDLQNNFLVKRLGYYADCNVLDAVPKTDGFFSLYPREVGELAGALYTTTNPPPAPLVDFMSVSQQTAPGQFFEWQSRTNFLPLATAGQQPVWLDDAQALRGILSSDFDGSRFVMLPLEARGRSAVTNVVSAQVKLTSYAAERVELEVEAAAPAWVVLSQSWYHRWRAYVDGRPEPLWRANYAFQALQVPAGKSHVRLSYEDGAFRAGAVISGLTLLSCLMIWWWFGRRRIS